MPSLEFTDGRAQNRRELIDTVSLPKKYKYFPAKSLLRPAKGAPQDLLVAHSGQRGVALSSAQRFENNLEGRIPIRDRPILHHCTYRLRGNSTVTICCTTANIQLLLRAATPLS